MTPVGCASPHRAHDLVFKNPNETDACGCGESVTIQPAELEH
jgi:iron-sulfur cluster assembly protein